MLDQLLIYYVGDDTDYLHRLEAKLSSFTHCTVRYLDDGSHLLTWLTHELDTRLPNLIILDLSFPIVNGYESLVLLKQDLCLRSIPVIVLTEYDCEAIQRRCMGLSTNICKPSVANSSQLLELVNRLTSFLH